MSEQAVVNAVADTHLGLRGAGSHSHQEEPDTTQVYYAIADTHLGLHERPIRFWRFYALSIVALAVGTYARETSHWILVAAIWIGIPYFAVLAKRIDFPLANVAFVLGLITLLITYLFDARFQEAIEPILPVILFVLLILGTVIHYASSRSRHSRWKPSGGDWIIYLVVIAALLLQATGVAALPNLVVGGGFLALLALAPYLSWTKKKSMTGVKRTFDFQTIEARKRERRVDGRHSDSPESVAAFLQWIIDRENGSQSDEDLDLRPPTDLILLGDILELWDAENQNVLFSVLPIANLLQQIQARKYYVLGNHDNILRTLEDAVLPLGLGPGRQSAVELRRAGHGMTVKTNFICLPLGDRRFVFMHGHQFARTSKWLFGWLRQTGASLGDWSLVFFTLVFLGALHASISTGSVVAALVVVAAFLLWFPRYYMIAARLIWKGRGFRYMPSAKAIRKAEGWWRDARKERWWKRLPRTLGDRRTNEVPPDNSEIVFGHTHTCWVGKDEKGSSSKPARLYNISSWVRVEENDEKPEFRPTIFYADNRRPAGRLLILEWSDKPPRLRVQWDSTAPGSDRFWELPG